MDSSHLHGPRGPRPSYPPRASSRSSTSTVNTRVTSQSANSLTSVSTSPQLSSSHPAHRFHHAACAKLASSPRLTPRHTPQLSREGSMESTRQNAASAFLQEKLQRERRAEGERAGHCHSAAYARMSHDMGGSIDLGRATPSSPMRTVGSDSPRPRSSAGASAGAEPAKKPGLGLMEMEQVISKLHKQNFDLKLELFHRREKQTALENQVETLENDKRQVDEINDNLLEELDKRDKAVEEAVAMIVVLEARIEQLVSERNMVQHVEREDFFYARDFDAKYENPVPNLCIPLEAPAAAAAQADPRAINRMPSFLSEETENTKNLRNVYLDVRGSAISLPRVSEGSLEPEAGPATGLASPTLSVLSESSFLSVYGKKDEEEGYPPPVDNPLSLDGVDATSSGVPVDYAEFGGKPGPLPARAASAAPFTRGSMPSSFSAGFFERPPRPSTTKVDGRRAPQPPPLQIPPARKLVREETREALQRVMSEAPGGVRLHDQALPPTPDTISTSTLDQMRAFRGHRPQRSGVSLRPEGAMVRSTTEGALRSEDSDDESDTRSQDIWMRESTQSRAPYLFEFPNGSKPDLISLRSALFAGTGTPPSPPDRRSSLRRHYPPITSRAGFNRLFRRSIGTAEGAYLAEAPRITSLLDERRSGATPPPILMNRRNTAGAEAAPPQAAEGDDACATPRSAGKSTPGTPSGTGIRRKWLPRFGKK